MAKAASIRTRAKFKIGGKDQAHHWWWFSLLGIVLIAGGAFMLGHLAAATLVSTIFIGAAALVLGAFQIVKAFQTSGWGGSLMSAAIGALYVVAGFLLWWNPIAGAISLTLVLAAVLVASGLVRLWLAYEHWHEMGGLLTLSGIIAILAGLVIFSGWPATGLWVLGLCLAIDVLFQGFAWLMFGFALRPR
ncbi:MAG TPA: HdeD family acid-resistance protein [Xanthobacteraceae bacterium]|nr:HdeD family acid-resistance protein [Xanthobacteraceae bacterium]